MPPASEPKRLEIKYVDVNELIPYGNNARSHTPEQVAQIVASIKEFGWTNPIITHGNKIVAGHARAAAARELDDKMVPTIDKGNLTDEQYRAYVIADNQLAQNSSWDVAMLSTEIIDLKALDFDIDLLGFGEFQLSNLLGTDDDDDDAGNDNDDDYEPEFFVIVEVASEDEQAALLDRFQKEGLNCKATQS